MSAQQNRKEFLLEIGAEEIPAWMIEPALADLKRLLAAGLTRLRLTDGEAAQIETYATPRRLVAYCPGLIARQPDFSEMVQGPPKRIAFDAAGKPTPAAVQFAAKMGTTPDKLKTVSTPKGEYLACKKKEKGRPTLELLGELVPEAVQGISFPRTMYWEGKAGPRFIRPIRSLLALFGGRVIPCQIGEVRSGNLTFGHRRLGKPRLRVRDFASYRETLRENFVLLDPAERRAKISEGIQTLLASESGCLWRENQELLDTLVHITEYPTILVGQFDPLYLALPQEVLVTVMRGHQKYFSVEKTDGSLAPRFVAVMNLDADRTGVIRHGHERVLRARFNDARFFWATDGKVSLEQRLEMLKHVTFQSKLGSYFEKAERMGKLANQLVLRLRDSGHRLEPEKSSEIIEAARLAKCDLTTELVKEFTELQGVVGGLYAKREGKSEEIATAIYDHYKPQSMDDASPRTLAGALVSLADRMDTLVGCFGVGLAPTGSKDPFGLRRAAQGVIRILTDHQIHLPLTQLILDTKSIYDHARDNGQVADWNGSNVLQEVRFFLKDRLHYYSQEIKSYSYDEVRAVETSTDSAPGEVVSVFLDRLEALRQVRPTENFEPLAAAFKRIKNILEQARKAHGFTEGTLDPALLEAGPESRLHERYQEVSSHVSREKQSGNFLAALAAIASLRPDVDLFFDKVLVMAPQPEVRNNRLTLLQNLLQEFSSIADFSEIVLSEVGKAESK